MDLAASGPLATIVIGKPTVLHAPVVHQRVSGSAIEADDIAMCV